MSSSWYQPAPFYLLRVPVLPSAIFATLSQHGHIDLSQEQDLEQAWMHARKASLQWLEQLAIHPLIEQALMVASPSLAEALGKQQGVQDRRKERAYERLLRYVVQVSPLELSPYRAMSCLSYLSQQEFVLTCSGC
jgi:hypothetical protein